MIDHHRRRGALCCLEQKRRRRGSSCRRWWLIVLTLTASIIPSGPSFATHVAHDGLPQWPDKAQAAGTSLFDWRLYAQGRYTHTSKPSERVALQRLKLHFGGIPSLINDALQLQIQCFFW